jgi:bacteriocin biosynthesis cyclodehydratase domain-containing protein
MTRVLPYLAPWYRVAMDDERVVLEHGQRIVCLEGRAATVLVPVLLPLLDGTRSVDEIVEILGEPARPAVVAALERLDEHDVLLDGPPLPSDLPAPVAATAELLASLRPGRISIEHASRCLGDRLVAVVGDGLGAVEIGRLLRQSGVSIGRADTVSADVDLAICAPAPSQLPLLSEWNRQALEVQQPWLQVLPFDGRYGSVGPLYLPDETCCFECFRRRRIANLRAWDEIALLENTPASYPTAPAFHAVMAGMATTLALEWLILRDQYVPSAFYALELVPSFSVTLHHVYRVPRCDACSGLGDVAAPLPWHKEVRVAGD